METHAPGEAPDGRLSNDYLKRSGVFSETLFEDPFSRGSASKCRVSVARTLQRPEALLLPHLNPRLPRRPEDGSWDLESDSTSVVRQNLTSCSSARLQSIKQTVMGMSTQCHVLWECGIRLRPRGCVRGLSSHGTGDAYYSSQAATFGQHYGQLQGLLEERSRLLFLQECSQRLRAASCYVTKLSALLDHERVLLVSRTVEKSSSKWNLGLQGLSQELRGHLNHWVLLCDKAHSDVHLRNTLFWWKETLCTMRQTFQLLGVRSLCLMEQCIYTALRILATEHLGRVPNDALEDLLASIHIFNHTVKDKFLHGEEAWRKHAIQLSNGPSSRLPRLGPEHGTFTVFQIMKIWAEQRGQMVAEQLCLWTSHQSDLITSSWPATETSRFNWKQPEQFSSILSNQVSEPDPNWPRTQAGSVNSYPSKAKKALQTCSCCTDPPFWSFIHRDCRCVEILFQALASTTDLLPHTPQPSRPGHLDGTLLGGVQRLAVRELQPGVVCEKKKSVEWRDWIKSELCLELLTQYREMLWTEFSNAATRCFFYRGHHNASGSMSQWRDHETLHVVTCLTHGFRGELIPAECADVLKGFCSDILYNSACMHWDEVMCDALGYSLKDKCLPEPAPGVAMVRTGTMERLVQLFGPLVMMLQHLKNKLRLGNGNRAAELQAFGALSRSVATVQSTALWVMGKAYQFLSSWHLSKFLLVTQGDLVVLQASLKRLAQEVEDLNCNGGHPVMTTLTAKLTRGVAELQAFPELILRVFSMDCKRVSIELFEQTMPSAKHWRVNYRTGLPSSPSEYATSAAQNVIGQVLEGVQLLPEEAGVPALTAAMTVFMEAWMEHILKQKIKFSFQGALQLKQDFELIRELIRSEEYSLSEELHQRLLSLRVFQQVDNAIMCLLQQPAPMPYMPSRAWQPFRHCCSSITQVDQAAGSLNNLDSMDVQAAYRGSLSQDPELSSALPDSYLPLAQQEWLDLRIHNSSRWRLPGLHCLTRSEP